MTNGPAGIDTSLCRKKPPSCSFPSVNPFICKQCLQEVNENIVTERYWVLQTCTHQVAVTGCKLIKIS